MFKILRRRKTPQEVNNSPGNDATDTAWRIHSALMDWTGKVDTKASFALTIESALLAGVVSLSSENGVFHGVSGWAQGMYFTGVALLVISVLCSVWVVRPRLRAGKLKNEAHNNYIYFGHLRYRKPQDVEVQLQEEPPLSNLSKQIVAMSKIAWTKHRLVQLSLTLAPLGVIALGASTVIYAQ